ncbi:MAG: HD domain-containing protein [Planctomycetes bacterium]|nr:HD domain-containing protein [Planctomycetota bacterium]MCW8134442.1 HD domain-containing protein [Planctomycetota bacterium]
MPSPKLPTVIRDPIHDIIPFEDTKLDALLLSLINTREFQRLRRIKQLGMAELVFPAANHSRFAHSIGVMHNARRFVEAVTKAGAPLKDNQKAAVIAAALLHDVGHGPFSHAFEKVTGDKHERRTLEVIQSPETEVHQTLKSFDKDVDLPKLIANFFDESLDDEALGKAGIPAFASQIVSSQLDADRTDFLLRDSHATGTHYGRFDLNWLIRSLKFIDNKIVVGKKGLSTVEQYVFARQHMYLRCYFHKTSHAAELMLKHVFDRFKNLLTEHGAEKVNGLVPGVNPLLVKAFSTGAKMPLADYQKLDDGTVSEFFRCCADSKDPTLAYLANGLLHRRLYKVVEATGQGLDKISDLGAALAEVVKSNAKLLPDSFPSKYVGKAETIKEARYTPYTPDEKRQSQIHVESATGKVTELSKEVPSIATLERQKDLLRYYYPIELQEKLSPVVEGVLKGGK